MSFLLRLIIALVLMGAQLPGQYIQGPKGGCYTVTKSGRKQYVDRSMCEGKKPEAPAAPRASGSPSTGKTYITGPRGGCYYVTPSGRKQYVDHSMCK